MTWFNHKNIAFIIITTAIVLSACYFTPFYLSLPEIIGCFVFFLYLGWLAWFFKTLSFTGIIAAAITGTQLTAISNYNILPLILFFMSGSLLSLLPTKRNRDEKAGKPRDGIQVYSNAGIALIVSIFGSFFKSDPTVLYLFSIAIACADTWASEIGSRYGGTTFNILNFRKTIPGISGGVTVLGFVASIAGAALIGMFAYNLDVFILIVFIGTIGSLVDSVMGSAFQAGYLDEESNLTDIPTKTLVKGFRWMTNDAVNFISNALVIALAVIYLLQTK